MGERRFTITASQVLSLQTFFARQAMISNLLPSWLFVRIGGTDIPNAASSDWAVPPMTAQIIPLPATNIISVGVGAPIVTLGQQVMAGQGAIVTLYDVPTPVAVGSMDLNPSRMGQMTQRTFTVPTSYTLPFPATTVHVANYSAAWLYVGIGTLVAPTVLTASIAVPPMSEKSLPCQPTALFAFAFSAVLVTLGDQVPAGMKVIATFYEYPTAVSVGTADLQPSKLGQSTQSIFVANFNRTLAFQATSIHVSNYSTKWVYVAYGLLLPFPTAANAMGSVPPFSERNLPCPPNTLFSFGFSAATIMIGTDIPQTNVVATFYEYPVPMALGAATLAPGGFRYREALHLPAAAVAHNTIIERDLSNFTWGKYTVSPDMAAGTLRILSLNIYDETIPATLALVGSLPLIQNYNAALTFHAGKKIWVTYTVDDMTAFTLVDWLEAW